MKRIFDLLVVLLVLPIVIPLMLIVAIMIKLDSNGPVLFKQYRVGLGGEVFSIFKFRSMRVNSESEGPYYTSVNDNRITRVGKFIRRTSLDELPQLFNVLRGDMSLVGPRPNVTEQRELYTDTQWNKRNSVRPGITGPAQAIYRSAATFEQRTELDLHYVDKQSFCYDIELIFLTIKNLLLAKTN